MVAAPIEAVDDGVGLGNHVAQSVDEEKLVVGNGTAQIHGCFEVGELVDDMVDLHIKPFVDDDAETALRLHVVDEQNDRPSEMEVVH